MAWPLADVRVVALEQAVAAPLCTRHLADLIAHPQLAARGRWSEVPSPAGALKALKPPFNLSEFEPRMDAVPALGAHSRGILAELGYGAGEIDRLSRDGAVTL